MEGWLYRAEARGIQSWILASDRFVELRGGSSLVECLGDDGRRLVERVGGRCKLAAAGTVEAWFPDEPSLVSFAEHWPLWVQARAPGLPLVHAWGPASRPGDLFERLSRLRPRVPMDLPEAGPLVARAGRTGIAAVRQGETKDGLEDRATAAKVDRKQDELASRLLPTPLTVRNARWSFVDDVGDYGDGYIAVVHVDGNRVGQLFRGLGPDPEVRWRVSSALSEATRAAARSAVKQLCIQTYDRLDDRRAEATPDGTLDVNVLARPVVLGGDDLTVIVHAQDALAFAVHYLRSFEHETGLRSREHEELAGLTACAGIAFVKPGWPFHGAHALAESLCRAAKAQLRDSAASGLLFHRVTTALSDLDWNELARRELEAANGRSFAWGAYSLDGIERLAALTTAASAIPRGALRGWLADARVDLARASVRWERLREVALHGRGDTDPAGWERFRQALLALRVDPESGWSSDDPPRTPLADALAWLSVQHSSARRLWSSYDA